MGVGSFWWIGTFCLPFLVGECARCVLFDRLFHISTFTFFTQGRTREWRKPVGEQAQATGYEVTSGGDLEAVELSGQFLGQGTGRSSHFWPR